MLHCSLCLSPANPVLLVRSMFAGNARTYTTVQAVTAPNFGNWCHGIRFTGASFSTVGCSSFGRIRMQCNQSRITLTQLCTTYLGYRPWERSSNRLESKQLCQLTSRVFCWGRFTTFTSSRAAKLSAGSKILLSCEPGHVLSEWPMVPVCPQQTYDNMFRPPH